MITYLIYFGFADMYADTIAFGKPVQYDEQYIKFKQHIKEIGALDLSDKEITKQIPERYWKRAVCLDIHLFPIDFRYIKNVLYGDRVFNLMSPMLKEKFTNTYYSALKLIVLHEEIRDNIRKNPTDSKNLELVICAYLGGLYRDHFPELTNTDHKILDQQRPIVQLWFNRVRAE